MEPLAFRGLDTGDLLFFSGRRIWSRLIQWRTGSEWSHVGLFVRIDQMPFVLESLEGVGVRLVPLSVWLAWPGHIGFATTSLEREQREHMLHCGLSLLGQRYAPPRQFVRSFSVLWSRLTRRWRLASDVAPDRWFCSELVAALIEQAGGDISDEPAHVSPGDLAADRKVCIVLGIFRPSKEC